MSKIAIAILKALTFLKDTKNILYIGGTNNIFVYCNIMCIGGYYIGIENQKLYMPKIDTVDLFSYQNILNQTLIGKQIFRY